MILLHSGNEAKQRIENVVQSASGDVYRTSPGQSLLDVIDDISSWIAQSKSPQLVVVDPATAAHDDELQAYRSLRRMAKFNGVDVHLVGDTSVEEIADLIVTKDDDLIPAAPGSSAGAQIASLFRSEQMSKFERVEMDVPTWQEIKATSGCTEQEAKDKVNWLNNQAVWANNLYQVNVEFMPGERAHLIIRRLDKQAIHSWQHFHEIKNQLLGPECEAVEIYPKESQLVDEKNHYHLWGFRSPESSFGIGFRVGRKVE